METMTLLYAVGIVVGFALAAGAVTFLILAERNLNEAKRNLEIVRQNVKEIRELQAQRRALHG